VSAPRVRSGKRSVAKEPTPVAVPTAAIEAPAAIQEDAPEENAEAGSEVIEVKAPPEQDG
jgi:hypothetical protein